MKFRNKTHCRGENKDNTDSWIKAISNDIHGEQKG
jgi:hypothetical protein